MTKCSKTFQVEAKFKSAKIAKKSCATPFERKILQRFYRAFVLEMSKNPEFFTFFDFVKHVLFRVKTKFTYKLYKLHINLIADNGNSVFIFLVGTSLSPWISSWSHHCFGLLWLRLPAWLCGGHRRSPFQCSRRRKRRGSGTRVT